jgi:hypothetical protein
MAPNFVNPAAHEGEITLERELPGRMTVSATYLLTRGLHLPSSYDSNVAPTTATRSYDVLTSTGATALTATVPFYTERLDNGSGLILTQFSVVNSWYNGLVLPCRYDVVYMASNSSLFEIHAAGFHLAPSVQCDSPMFLPPFPRRAGPRPLPAQMTPRHWSFLRAKSRLAERTPPHAIGIAPAIDCPRDFRSCIPALWARHQTPPFVIHWCYR